MICNADAHESFGKKLIMIIFIKYIKNQQLFDIYKKIIKIMI